MIHNVEINCKVRVNGLSDELYQKILDMIKGRMGERLGLEDWELNWIMNPNELGQQKPRKTFFPVSIELPELSRDSIETLSKIEIVG
jgi:hypothetical protein